MPHEGVQWQQEGVGTGMGGEGSWRAQNWPGASGIHPQSRSLRRPNGPISKLCIESAHQKVGKKLENLHEVLIKD
jgi:hypothetical protein